MLSLIRLSSLHALLSLGAILSLSACLEVLRDPFVDARRGKAHNKNQSIDLDAENTDCSKLASESPREPMRPLTNVEYDQSLRELMAAPDNASAAFFPPDAMGTGFDTGAIRAMTPGMVQSYFDASQSLTSLYINRPGIPCADQGFALNCTKQALKSFAEKAFRRPLLKDESTRLPLLLQNFVDQGLSPKDAYAASLSTILLSPQFLYRQSLAPEAGLPASDQYAFAQSLAFALWASLPDQRLLDLAQKQSLTDPKILSQEIDRMLQSPKKQGFLRNFLGQWLGTKTLSQAPAAKNLNPALVTAYQDETLSFVSEVLEKNLPFSQLLSADFTFANAALATQYGLASIEGSTLRRVALSSPQRGGLLTQGAFLVQSSNPDSTSPVKRGKWVLDRLLCAPPPAPPPGVSTTLPSTPGKSLPMRQRLEAHRQGSCASCHQLMDPIGLAFENYDRTGAWRDADDFGAIDATGELPNRGSFGDAHELATLIEADPRFPRCFAKKTAQYLLGREPTAQEQCLLNGLAQQTQTPSYGLKNFVADIARTLFAMKVTAP